MSPPVCLAWVVSAPNVICEEPSTTRYRGAQDVTRVDSALSLSHLQLYYLDWRCRDLAMALVLALALALALAF